MQSGIHDNEGAPSGACVLVVDDDREFTSLLSQALTEDGHRVIVGGSGFQLVDYVMLTLRRSPPVPTVDLIVSDIRMPNGTGFDALEQLRRHPGAPPILLMTAFGSESVHDEAARLGAVGVINKPFDIDDFRTIVLNLVDGRNLGARGGASELGASV